MMGLYKTIPEMVVVGRAWTIPDFQPMQPAYRYDEYGDKDGFIYAIGCNEFHKLGMTTNFKKRLSQLDSAAPYTMEKVATRRVPLAGMAYAEAWMHKQVEDRLIKNEWFAIDRQHALDLIKAGYYAAKIYADYCRRWWVDERERKKRPEVRAKLELEYQEFLSRTGQAGPTSSAPAIDALLRQLA